MVLWSGGWDSTAAVFNALKDGHKVTAVQIGLVCNSRQRELETTAVDAMYDKFVKLYSEFTLRRVTVDFACHDEERPTLGQPVMWALGAALAFRENEHFDNLCCGYIKKDCFWHVRQAFEQSVRGNIACQTKNASLKKFWYPFEWFDKIDVYNRILTDMPELAKHIKTCEHPRKYKDKILQCGKCEKCKEIKAAKMLHKETLKKKEK